MDPAFPLGSAGFVAIELPTADGDRIVGIRSNVATALARVRERLASLVVEGVEPFANVSIKIGEKLGSTRLVHNVLRGSVVVSRPRTEDAAIDDAIDVLHTFVAPPAGCVRLPVRVAVRDGRAVVLTIMAGDGLGRHSRRLADAGWHVLPFSPVLIDAERAEVLVPAGRTPSDITSLTRAARLPISHLVEFVPAHLQGASISPAQSLSQLTGLISRVDQRMTSEGLDALLALVRRVGVIRMLGIDDGTVVDTLLQL
jgi:hypothetical protein